MRLFVLAAAVIITIYAAELIENSKHVSTLGADPVTASSKPSLQTTNTLSENITIVVDAGHGGFDPGTFGVETNTAEMDINLAIAQRLESVLEGKGFHVIMTRTDGKALAETKEDDMQCRCQIIADNRVDLAVSIHQNWYEDSSVSGPQVFFYPGSDKGSALAGIIQSSLNKDLSVTEPRQSLPEDYLLLKAGNAPAVIVECGFLSNPGEERSLLLSDYQQTIAESIAKSILQYIQNN
ncbi:MAG: N-acetylmuramoyl-L-alanine amidase [Christensenellales bacterium]